MLLEDLLQKLELRRSEGLRTASEESPRVFVTGCPIGGDTKKVFHTIEGVGGAGSVQRVETASRPGGGRHRRSDCGHCQAIPATAMLL